MLLLIYFEFFIIFLYRNCDFIKDVIKHIQFLFLFLFLKNL